jgi:hypothetical protein
MIAEIWDIGEDSGRVLRSRVFVLWQARQKFKSGNQGFSASKLSSAG